MTAQLIGLGWVTAGGLGGGRQQSPFALNPGKLPRLTRKAVFAAPDQRFGRLDDFSKLGLAGIVFALRDAGLETWSGKRPVGLVAATEYGCLQTDAAYFATVLPEHGRLTSPNLFAYTLSSCFLGEAAIRFGLTGPSFVLHDAAPAGLAAFQVALQLLAWGEAATVVAGVCNLPGPFPALDAAGAVCHSGRPLAGVAELVGHCREQRGPAPGPGP